MIELSVIVPVYNSEESLCIFVEHLISEVSKKFLTFEIICVDDGSSDQSWRVIRRLYSQYPQVVGIRLSRNFGQWPATICGLQHSKGSVLLTLDDDGQYDPKDGMALVELVLSGKHDVVCGMNHSLKSRFFEMISRTLLSKRHTSSLIAMRREVILSGENLPLARMGLDAQIKWAFDPSRVHHEYVIVKARLHGTSGYHFFSRAKPVIDNFVNYLGVREIAFLLGLSWLFVFSFSNLITSVYTVSAIIAVASIFYLSAVLHELRGRPYYWVIEKCQRI